MNPGSAIVSGVFQKIWYCAQRILKNVWNNNQENVQSCQKILLSVPRSQKRQSSVHRSHIESLCYI